MWNRWPLGGLNTWRLLQAHGLHQLYNVLYTRSSGGYSKILREQDDGTKTGKWKLPETKH